MTFEKGTRVVINVGGSKRAGYVAKVDGGRLKIALDGGGEVFRGRLAVEPERLATGKPPELFRWPRSPLGLVEEDVAGVWELLIASVLLGAAPASRVRDALEPLFERWPTPASLAHANVTDVRAVLEPLGLSALRAPRLILLSMLWNGGGWRDPASLPGIGFYGRAAWRIFVEGRLDVEAADPNLIRFVAWARAREATLAEDRKAARVANARAKVDRMEAAVVAAGAETSEKAQAALGKARAALAAEQATEVVVGDEATPGLERGHRERGSRGPDALWPAIAAVGAAAAPEAVDDLPPGEALERIVEDAPDRQSRLLGLAAMGALEEGKG